MHSKTNLSGNVTIALTLTLTICLSLIFTILESARLTSIKTHFIDVTHLCADSLFSNYCSELFNEYGVFGINTTDIDINNFLETYISDNISEPTVINILLNNYNLLEGSLESLNTTNYIYLTDNDGKIFCDQIEQYMSYKEISEIAESIINTTNTTSVEIYDITDESFDYSTVDLSVLDNPPPNDYSECLDISDEEANNYKTSMSDYIASILQENILLFVLEHPDTISKITVDRLTLPSVTTEFTSEGSAIAEGYYSDSDFISYERILFEEYTSMTFGCYTDPHPNSMMKYEQEYLINGSPEDDQNLLNTAVKLIFLRGSFNAVFIIKDSKKRTAASELAAKCVGSTPVLKQIVEFGIISTWAIAEGVIDVRDLLKGKKVPLIKDESTWTLDLGSVTSLAQNLTSKNDGSSGFDYQYYLKLLLAAQSEMALRFRTMDLIQLNICKNYNPTFRMNNCVCGIDISVSYKTPNIFLNLNNLIDAEKSETFTINETYFYD